MDRRQIAVTLAAALVGAGASVGAGACGEDREGSVEVEGGTSGTTGTAPVPETIEQQPPPETSPTP